MAENHRSTLKTINTAIPLATAISTLIKTHSKHSHKSKSNYTHLHSRTHTYLHLDQVVIPGPLRRIVGL